MGVMKLTPGQNPDASGILSYGTEGDAPGFQVTTEGGITANGNVTIAGTLTVGGTPITGGGGGSDVFPPEGYGCVGMSGDAAAFKTSSSFDSGQLWVVRIWIPANKVVGAVGAAVTVAATGGAAANTNGAVVYEDDGTLAGSGTDANLWTVDGLRFVALSVPVAAQTSGRFCRVGVLVNGWTGTQLAFTGGASTLDKSYGGSRSGTNRRSLFDGGHATFPASIDPATFGSSLAFSPLLLVAES